MSTNEIISLVVSILFLILAYLKFFRKNKESVPPDKSTNSLTQHQSQSADNSSGNITQNQQQSQNQRDSN